MSKSIKESKLFVICNKDGNYQSHNGITFSCFYNGKKKRWRVAHCLYELLVELEKLQKD